MLLCLNAATLAPRVTRAPWPASTLATLTLAGHKGRITSLETRRRFPLFGAGALSALPPPGHFNEALTGGALSAACDRSPRLFARAAQTLTTRGTARAAQTTRHSPHGNASRSIHNTTHHTMLGADRHLTRGARNFSAARVAPLRRIRGGSRPPPSRPATHNERPTGRTPPGPHLPPCMALAIQLKTSTATTAPPHTWERYAISCAARIASPRLFPDAASRRN